MITRSEASQIADEARHFATPVTMAERFSGGEWKRARHLDVIDFEFRNLINSDSVDCLIIKTPPRFGKSEYLARWAQVWYKLRYPTRNQIICTNTSTLATTHSRWVRDKVHQLAPMVGLKGVDPTFSSVRHWNLDGGGMGGMLSAGVGGSIIGASADLLTIDDYVKDAKSALSKNYRDDQWDWFVSVAATRLSPKGKIVILCTQWNQDDLIGRIQERKHELGLRVRCVTMQAICDGTRKDPLRREIGESLWPERWPLSLLEVKRKLAGKWWQPLYQGNPINDSDTEWPAHYFANRWLDQWPDSHPPMAASFLDPSKGKNSRKGDYSAAVYAAWDGQRIIVDSSIDRRPVPKMVRDFALFNQERRPTFVGIEANAFQELLGGDYLQSCEDVGYNCDPPILDTNTVNKHVRIQRLGTWFEQGLIWFRRNESNELLLQQLRDFPYGDHDDGPDALECAIRILCESVGQVKEIQESSVN